ncbi:MAG: hypothetical protein K6F99_09095 [Lachnospiraceae bacterium]|nr:hypothetical protein [Lachnospiraceae bacterium]
MRMTPNNTRRSKGLKRLAAAALCFAMLLSESSAANVFAGDYADTGAQTVSNSEASDNALAGEEAASQAGEEAASQTGEDAASSGDAASVKDEGEASADSNAGASSGTQESDNSASNGSEASAGYDENAEEQQTGSDDMVTDPVDKDTELLSDDENAEEDQKTDKAAGEADSEASLQSDPGSAYKVIVNSSPEEATVNFEYQDGCTEDSTDTIVYVEENAKCIYVTISTPKDKDSDTNYGIKEVTAKIGGSEAYVEQVFSENASETEKFIPDGQYVIKKDAEGNSLIDGDVTISVKTEKVHFVGFTSVNNRNIGCIPLPASKTFIPTVPWEGGVYVYDGMKLTCEFSVPSGNLITKVTQGSGGEELTKTGDSPDYYYEENGKGYIRVGKYETGEIYTRTYLYVYSESDVYFVSFDTGDSEHIGCVPDGGSYIGTDPWAGGVYVYDGESFTFHFNVDDGYRITKVTLANTELTPENDAFYDESEEIITTGTYKTGSIKKDTVIKVSYEEKNGNIVSLGIDSDSIEFVQESGDCIPVKTDGDTNKLYVYDGKDFSFHFNVDVSAGLRIKCVTLGGLGNITPYGRDVYVTTDDGEYIKTCTYTIPSTYIPKVNSIVVTSEAKNVHFVSFNTGNNHSRIDCVPGNSESLGSGGYIATDPWKDGVYVYDNIPLIFNFKVNKGCYITGVKSVAGTASTVLKPNSYEQPKTEDNYVITPSYNTVGITADTEIEVTSTVRQLLVNSEAIVLDDASPIYKSPDGLYYLSEEYDENKPVKFSIKDGYNVDSVTCRIINWYEDDNGELKYELATAYPGSGKTIITPDKNGYYYIENPKAADDDSESNLGLEITANVKKLATVSVNLKDADANTKDARYFDLTARVGSETYPVSYNSETKGYDLKVPVDSKVVLELTSKDEMWTISSVIPTDESKNSGKSAKAAKNGEYTLTVGESGASLVAAITPVTKLVITDESGNALGAVKNKYTLKDTDTFKAYLASGSTITEDNGNISLSPNTVTEGVAFYNNKTGITESITDGVLTTTGATLGVSSLPLTVKYNGKDYKTTFAFISKPKGVTITSPKPEGDTITVPYGQKATIKVKIDGNLTGINAYIYKIRDTGGQGPLNNINDIGSFDGKTITIDPQKAIDYPAVYKPGESYRLVFGYSATDMIAESEYSLYFSTQDLSGKTPGVTENPSLSTNHKIGLSLSMPKGLKATDGMYYMITAKVSDDDKDKLSKDGTVVYKESVGPYYVPVTEKTYALDVTEGSITDQDTGWSMKYDVTTTLIYYDEDAGEVIGGQSDETKKTFATKDCVYETKLGLTSKMPKKIYNMQNDIPIAVPKWSKTTGVQALEKVELLDPYGAVMASWDNAGNEVRIDVDEDTGLITLDTKWEYTVTDSETEKVYTYDANLDAGKYTLYAYAVNGTKAAKLPVTILESINAISIEAPARVVKSYGKAVTVDTKITYNNGESVPATKNVKLDIVNTEGSELSSESPLYEKISVTNGKVIIDKSLMTDSSDADAYKFKIKVTADDFDGNEVTALSGAIQISSTVQIPTEFQFVWEDENGQSVFSSINEESIALKAKKAKDIYEEPFYSRDIHNSKIIVLDQNGEPMDATLKLSGIRQNSEGRLILTKPGKVTISATAMDGGKKSKKLSFTIANGDVRYTPNVLIQRCNDDSGYINIAEGSTFENSLGLNTCTNEDAWSLYVHVAGIREGYPDVDENGNLCIKEDQHITDNVMFDHSVKVSGANILSTTTEMLDNYTTYVIKPNRGETVITLTDKTNNKQFGRSKKDYTYTITNELIESGKTVNITADKDTIQGRIYMKKENYLNVYSPNTVNFVIAEPVAAKSGITQEVMFCLDDPESSIKDYVNDNSRYTVVYNNEISIPFFKTNQQYSGKDGEIAFDAGKAKKLDFYLIYGYHYNNDESETFHAYAEPVKMSLSITPSASGIKFGLRKTSYKLELHKPNDADVNDYFYGCDESRPCDYIPLPDITAGGFEGNIGVHNMTSQGKENGFDRLFQKNEMGYRINNFKCFLTVNREGVLAPAESPGEFNVSEENYFDISIGSGDAQKTAKIKNISDVYALKNGELKDDDEQLIGTKSDQQKAYKEWVKENCTGYLSFKCAGYAGGEEKTYYVKVTVDLDDFFEHYDEAYGIFAFPASGD